MIRPWLLRPGSRWMPNVLISSEVGWSLVGALSPVNHKRLHQGWKVGWGGGVHRRRERENRPCIKFCKACWANSFWLRSYKIPYYCLRQYIYRRKFYIGAQRSCTLFRSAVTHAVVWALKTNYSQSFFMLNTGHSDAEKRMNIRISTLFRYMNLLGGPC